MKRLLGVCFLLGLMLLAINSGCLITRHNTNVIRKNEKPRTVQFESAEAKNIFDGKLAEVKASQISTMSNPRVFAVPFLLWYSSTDVVSENGVRNDQLAICDANGDGVIAYQEVMTYAARVDEQIAQFKKETPPNAQPAQVGQNPGQPNATQPYATPQTPPVASASYSVPPVPPVSPQPNNVRTTRPLNFGSPTR